MNANNVTLHVVHQPIALDLLRPHPKNPRIEPRQDIIDQLSACMADGFDWSHSLIVRPMDDGAFQIISGHHRWMAAQKAGLTEIPCWVREMSDADAYMQLVLCNTQSELHPLEEGKHAAESAMDLKAYAEQSGKAQTTLRNKLMAWRVATESHVGFDKVRDCWRNLAEIHAAPEWLWSALVNQMLADQWTVAKTREKVAAFKEIGKRGLPNWIDADGVASAVVSGAMRPNEVDRLGTTASEAKVDARLQVQMYKELRESKPFRLSAVQAVVAKWEQEQARLDADARRAELVLQQSAEEAQQRVASLIRNCSLDQWKGLNDEERSMLLAPAPSEGGTFNQQKGDSIEWAQWSWNPVTGCRHECPYCYARDIALGERMQQSNLYPNGWEPTFRSAALNAPKNTRVPKEAATDTRYRNVFTCSMADLFGRWVPVEWIDAVMMAVQGNPQWNFLFLTKFPQRFAEIEIPANAWMGTTVDMQARVKNAEKAFESVKSGVRWLSVEPMIEPITLTRPDLFNWVVIGGASSSKQTPTWQPPYRWIESLVRQCDDAGVPVYMKSNLGIANRVLSLPFDAPIKGDPQSAPEAFHYLGSVKE